MNICHQATPPAPPADIIAWAEANVKVNGGKTSFDVSLTPQIIKPIRAMVDFETRVGTLVKPIQSGGSTAGEVITAYWAAYGHGLFQFNWEDDQKAEKRWKDRVLPAVESCKDVKFSGERFETTIGELRLSNVTLRCQGVFTETNLDSDTVPLQINEEIHAWKPGHLAKARGRQTRVWNPKAFDISNAADAKTQLHEAYEDGTMEVWQVKCPGCGQFHVMRTRWEDSRPDLGGLRYDSDKCRMPNGRFNYNLLEKTVRYQMPCGFLVHDTPRERRALIGDYSPPTNEGAHISHRSWNYEAVSVAPIRWMDLIREKHAALRALKAGDKEPWRRYITERECRFFSDDSMPFEGRIVVSSGIVKKREGMPNRVARLWKADWQQGRKGEGQLEHFWLVIKDVDAMCNDLIVFEGMVNSENELIAELERHDAIENGSGVVDCSFNTKHLLQFCYQNKLNAIMSNESHRGTFLHREDGVRRFYDEGSAICGKLNVPPIFDPIMTERGPSPHPQEPIVISVNKGGMIANHFFIREHKERVLEAAKKEGREATADEYIECTIPGDVSQDFKEHYESWVRVGKDAKKKADEVHSGAERFQQVRRDDHMLICCAGIDMLKDFSGLLGERLALLGIERDGQPKEEAG